MVKSKSTKPASERRTKRPGRLRSVLRYGFLALAIAICIPLVLTLLYRIEAIRPVSTLMIGQALNGTDIQREWVEIDDMAPILYQTVLMSEDGQFCAHHGVDFGAMREVISEALSGDGVRGASTITMQVAKNLFLWPQRSYLRKLLEAPLALWIDLVLPKDRIMEIYLNIAEWGPGIFGAQAASMHHFGRSAANVSARQASLLAVSLPNPITRVAGKPSANLDRVARVIAKRATYAGDYTKCLP